MMHESLKEVSRKVRLETKRRGKSGEKPSKTILRKVRHKNEVNKFTGKSDWKVRLESQSGKLDRRAR
jgi:hypothetical protein